MEKDQAGQYEYKVRNKVKKIVIIGGGFAGMSMAQKLANKEGIQITLVDRNYYNYFTPLLYQLATGFLEVSNISSPYRSLFIDKKNIQFRFDELREVMPGSQRILLSTGDLAYDVLVIVTVSARHLFGRE